MEKADSSKLLNPAPNEIQGAGITLLLDSIKPVAPGMFPLTLQDHQ
jgi:hypothetical protein